MNKLIDKINEMKNDTKNINVLIKCFVNNSKANELFSNNKIFNRLKKVS